MADRHVCAAGRAARHRPAGPGERGAATTLGERRLDLDRFVGDPPDGRPVGPGQHLLAAPSRLAWIVPVVAGHTTGSGGQRGARGGSLRRLDPGRSASEPAASLLASVAEQRRGHLLEPPLPPDGLGRAPRRPRLSGRRTRRRHRRARRSPRGARCAGQPLVVVAPGLDRRPPPGLARVRCHHARRRGDPALRGAAGRHGLSRRPGRRLHAERRIVGTRRVHARRLPARIGH